MCRCVTVCLLSAASLLTLAPPMRGAEPKPVVPVSVRVTGPKGAVKAGQPIPLTLTIENGLPGPVDFSTYALEPNAWNGETFGVTLVDIYRSGEPGNRFLARPKIDPPLRIAGQSRHEIGAGKALEVRIDASKWQLRDGWQAGTYKVTARVGVTADGGRVQLGVHSDPVEFTVAK